MCAGVTDVFTETPVVAARLITPFAGPGPTGFAGGGKGSNDHTIGTGPTACAKSTTVFPNNVCIRIPFGPTLGVDAILIISSREVFS